MAFTLFTCVYLRDGKMCLATTAAAINLTNETFMREACVFAAPEKWFSLLVCSFVLCICFRCVYGVRVLHHTTTVANTAGNQPTLDTDIEAIDDLLLTSLWFCSYILLPLCILFLCARLCVEHIFQTTNVRIMRCNFQNGRWIVWNYFQFSGRKESFTVHFFKHNLLFNLSPIITGFFRTHFILLTSFFLDSFVIMFLPSTDLSSFTLFSMFFSLNNNNIFQHFQFKLKMVHLYFLFFHSSNAYWKIAQNHVSTIFSLLTNTICCFFICVHWFHSIR